MKIKEEGNLVIIKAEDISFSDFSASVQEELDNGVAKGKNLILDLLKLTDLELADILTFQELSDTHTESKCSFVIVNKTVNHNDLPQNLHVTPTLQEAKDIIEMEEIERDLGF